MYIGPWRQGAEAAQDARDIAVCAVHIVIFLIGQTRSARDDDASSSGDDAGIVHW